MERRHCTTPVKLETRENNKPAIVGYAAVYYDPKDPGTEFKMYDDLVERIMPGAFDRAAREDDCRALFNHNPDMVLGRTASGTCKLTVDAKGLRYEIDPGDTTCCKDVQQHLGRGDVTGSSFAFTVDRQSWVDEKRGDNLVSIRQIEAITLYDVGPVTYPAYEATTAATRSGSCDDAKAALAQHRADVSSKLTQYAARARAVSID